LPIADDALRKKFESDEAVELGVFRFVNNAHSAAAEFFDDPEMRNRAANQGGRIRHWSAILVSSGWASQRKRAERRNDQNGGFSAGRIE
jgi:hypothetical protein